MSRNTIGNRLKNTLIHKRCRFGDSHCIKVFFLLHCKSRVGIHFLTEVIYFDLNLTNQFIDLEFGSCRDTEFFPKTFVLRFSLSHVHRALSSYE